MINKLNFAALLAFVYTDQRRGDIPIEIANANILPATSNANGIAKFNGARITVKEKWPIGASTPQALAGEQSKESLPIGPSS